MSKPLKMGGYVKFLLNYLDVTSFACIIKTEVKQLNTD